jgi:hypothetical protein
VKVVADSSPLIALAKIDEFGLLRELFSKLLVTPEVLPKSSSPVLVFPEPKMLEPPIGSKSGRSGNTWIFALPKSGSALTWESSAP